MRSTWSDFANLTMHFAPKGSTMTILTAINMARLPRAIAWEVLVLVAFPIAGCASTSSNSVLLSGVEAAAIQRDGQRLFAPVAPDGHPAAPGQTLAGGRMNSAEGGLR